MIPIGIFLDDERNPEDVTWVNLPNDIQWSIIRNPDNFKTLVQYFMFEGDIFSFDNDIACFDQQGNETKGYDLLKWLMNYCLDNNIKIPVCYFHTQNIVDKKAMKQYYECALREEERRNEKA